ncbi:MAG: hypothetical protein DSZ24_00510 [Thermodesulfatator sp.]|nr:MAG: hypothetical protein DSZ24_00510 [Thermodesulfatator sp.]
MAERGRFSLRIGTLLWFMGIVSVVALTLTSAGGFLSIRRADKIIADLTGFNLPVTNEMCQVSYLLGQQRALLGLSNGSESQFRRNSAALMDHLRSLHRYLQGSRGANQEEEELLSRLRENVSGLERDYRSFHERALKYLSSRNPEEAQSLREDLQAMDQKTFSFLNDLGLFNEKMRKRSEGKSRRDRRRALLVFGVSLLLLGLSFASVLRFFRRNVNDYRLRMQDLAEGEADLTKRVAITGNTELDEAAVYTNRFLEKIHTLIRDLRETAERLSGETRRLAEAFGISVKGAEKGLVQSRKAREFASELEQEIVSMAAAMEEMSATISEISRNTQETSARARESQEAAEMTARVATDLQEASRNIREMSDLIGTVAEQTKLLALNATIEAARAGEAGKGFAVVANEVKELARQSAELVEKINHAVEQLLSKVEEVTEASQRNREAANAIADMAQNVAAAVEEQSTVVNDLSANLTKITEKSKELSQEAEEMEKTSQEILEEARKLNVEELTRVGARLEELLRSFKV